MRIFLTFIWRRFTMAVIIAFVALAVGSLTLFFGGIVFGLGVDFVSTARWTFIVLYLLDTLWSLWVYAKYALVARVLKATYTDVWEAVNIYRIQKEAYKSPEAFKAALNGAKLARSLEAIAVAAIFGDSATRRR